MLVTISTKGQVVLPAELRAQDGIIAGQQFDIERIANGEYSLRRHPSKRNEGLVKLLLACPSRGWFQPLSRAETTDAFLRPTCE
jgi:AbrB family looped-hinge helix DNA binding protein